jgi:hypothetical protein
MDLRWCVSVRPLFKHVRLSMNQFNQRVLRQCLASISEFYSSLATVGVIIRGGMRTNDKFCYHTQLDKGHVCNTTAPPWLKCNLGHRRRYYKVMNELRKTIPCGGIVLPIVVLDRLRIRLPLIHISKSHWPLLARHDVQWIVPI